MLRFHSFKLSVPRHHEAGVFNFFSMLYGAVSGVAAVVFPLVVLRVTGSEAMVGWYFAAMAGVGLVAALVSTGLFTRVSKVWVFQGSFAVAGVVYGGLTVADTLYGVGGMDIPRMAALTLAWVALGLFVNDFAVKKELPAVTGRFFLWNNVGWLLGPVAGGSVMNWYGTDAALLLSAGLCMLAWGVFAVFSHGMGHPHLGHGVHTEPQSEGMVAAVREFFTDPHLRRVFLVAVGVQTWWSVSGAYMPVQLTHLGFSPFLVGLSTGLANVSLILLEGYVGRYAEKKGYRLPLAFGFALLAVMVGLFYPLLALPMVFFVVATLANTGSAFVEPLKDAAFYEHAGRRSERLAGVYQAYLPLASCVMPLLAGMVVQVWGLSALWLVTAAAMVPCVFLGWYMERR